MTGWRDPGGRARPGRYGRPSSPPPGSAAPSDLQPAAPETRLTWQRDERPVERPAPEALVQFRHVFKIYRVADTGVVALGGLDLEVRTGEFLTVVGPSGSGKSTVLNLAGGLDRASAGSVEVEGRDLGRLSDTELTVHRRDRVGFVWQGTARNLVPYLTLRANVGVPLIARGQARWTRRRADELLGVVGLAHRARHRPDQLSGGEQQRAAIAVALANLPPLLLADEPTAELDSVSADQVLSAFREVNREFGVTIVMVTHDLVAARKADRIIRLRDGHVVREGHAAGRVDDVGRVRLPEQAVEALWQVDLEAEVHGTEVRLRPRSERRPGRG